MSRETDIAYLAGIVEADGCIRVDRMKNNGRSRDGISFAPLVTIQQIEPEAVNLAKELFGGSVSVIKPPPKMPKARFMLRWTAKSRIAVAALEAIRPFLRIKVQQADNAIKLGYIVRSLNLARYRDVLVGVCGPRHRTEEEFAELSKYHELAGQLNSGRAVRDYEQMQKERTAQMGMVL